MPVRPVVIANNFIKLDKESKGEGFDLMQLIKLSYIAHGVYLAQTSKPLSCEQAIAWPKGPVFKSLTYLTLNHGLENKFTEKIETIGDLEKNLTSKMTEVIKRVYEKYKGKSGKFLSGLTHEDNTPWAKTLKKYGGAIKEQVIDDETIKEHYKRNFA